MDAFGSIADEDKARLCEVITADVRDYPARTDVITEGENPHHVHLIVSGFACRYKLLQSGERQIVAFLVPGDFCDLHTIIMRATDHNIATIAPSQIVEIPKSDVDDLLNRPSLAKPMLMSTLVDEATMREWIANIGQRPAIQRTAHLFCELFARYRTVGLTERNSFELPLTQSELADALGLSLVHMNRSLQALRRRQLISLASKRLVIHDVSELQKVCDFTSNYLHLDEKPDPTDLS